jgi:GxxExxY protein
VKSPALGRGSRDTNCTTNNQKEGAMSFAAIPADAEQVARAVVDAAHKVHSVLGPGLLASVYEACLAHELRRGGLEVSTHVTVPVEYEGLRLETGLKLGMLVADQVVVEVKAVEVLSDLFVAQVQTYLRLTGLQLGFLINFEVSKMRDGIKSVVR